MKFGLTISEFRSLFLRKVIGFKPHWLMPYSEVDESLKSETRAGYMRNYRKKNARFTF